MTWRELSPEQLMGLKNAVVIDVRSPGEHAVECIPHSINIPLLDDIQRAEVGTVYAREGEATARLVALRLISPKIPDIVDEIIALKEHGASIVIHCWRGGLRSEAVASFLTVVGVDAWRLTGGYKAWRKLVIEGLHHERHHYDPVILHGQTGCGKTELLAALTAAGASVIDLEALANHRGSVFGALNLSEQPTQKNFEAALWLALQGKGTGPVFIEAESRKIGKITLPDLILDNIKRGRRILVTGTAAVRARRIWKEYSGSFDMALRDQALAALDKLRERLGNKRTEEIRELVEAQKTEQAIEILLADYYDPLYAADLKRHAPYDLVVDGDEPRAAAGAILAHFDAIGVNCTAVLSDGRADKRRP